MVILTFAPGQDVGDRLREDVGPLLVEQRGDVARCRALLVDGARFLAALDDAAHGAVADQHGHVVDRGVLRERERCRRLRSSAVAVFSKSCVTVTRARNPLIRRFTSVCLSGQSP